MKRQRVVCARRDGAPSPLRVWLLACLLLLVTSAVLAQSGGGYDLTWSSVDGGGYTFSTGGGYSLGGTAGQPDAGLLSGAEYTLGGGLWRGGALAVQLTHLHIPQVLRGSP